MIIFCPDIELTTKRSSFLLQIAVRLRSTSRHKQSALSLWCSYTDGLLTEILSDVFIVFSSCIVERTCGALTVWSTVYFQLPRHDLLILLSSTRIRSWSLPGWQSSQIFNPEPFHFLSFQCRTSYLSWTAGIFELIEKLLQVKKKIILPTFFSLPIMKRPSSLSAYYNSSLDSLWKNLKIFNLRLNGLLVMVWRELKRCFLLHI